MKAAGLSILIYDSDPTTSRCKLIIAVMQPLVSFVRFREVDLVWQEVFRVIKGGPGGGGGHGGFSCSVLWFPPLVLGVCAGCA